MIQLNKAGQEIVLIMANYASSKHIKDQICLDRQQVSDFSLNMLLLHLGLHLFTQLDVYNNADSRQELPCGRHKSASPYIKSSLTW